MNPSISVGTDTRNKRFFTLPTDDGPAIVTDVIDAYYQRDWVPDWLVAATRWLPMRLNPLYESGFAGLLPYVPSSVDGGPSGILFHGSGNDIYDLTPEQRKEHLDSLDLIH